MTEKCKTCKYYNGPAAYRVKCSNLHPCVGNSRYESAVQICKLEPEKQNVDREMQWLMYHAAFGDTRSRTIAKVIFNEPATIVFWEDGTKTVVKCQDGDVFDKEKGLAMAIAKKSFGNKGNYCNVFKKFIKED